MKEKGNRIFSGICNGIFAATLLTEAVCALVWGFYNLRDYKNFAESADLYAALNGHAGFFPVLYILQILISAAFLYFGSAAFLRALTGDKVPAKYPVLVTLWMLFNPYIWMLQFTLLPDAVGLPVAFLILSYAFLFYRNAGSKKDWLYLLMCTVWFVAEGIFFRKIFAAILPAICIFGIMTLIKLVGKGKNEKTEHAPNPENDANKGLSAVFALGMIFIPILVLVIVFIKRISGVPQTGIPGVPAFAEYIFRVRLSGMTEYSFGSIAGFLKGFCKEWLAGILSPWLLAFVRYPWGDSVNPFYESIFWQKAPVLTVFYLRSAGIGFAAYTTASFMKGVWNLFFSKGKNRTGILSGILGCAACIVLPAFIFLLFTIPEFDFRNAMISYMTWAVSAAALAGTGNILEGE